MTKTRNNSEQDINKAWAQANEVHVQSLDIVRHLVATDMSKYLLNKAFENISISVEADKIDMWRMYGYGCIAATEAAGQITEKQATQLNQLLMEQSEARTAYVHLSRAAAVR